MDETGESNNRLPVTKVEPELAEAGQIPRTTRVGMTQTGGVQTDATILILDTKTVEVEIPTGYRIVDRMKQVGPAPWVSLRDADHRYLQVTFHEYVGWYVMSVILDRSTRFTNRLTVTLRVGLEW